MSPSPHWLLRQRLSPQARGRLRRVVDPALAWGLGSWSSTNATNEFSLTLDDGPDPTVTPEVLDVFDEEGARCTFFLLVAQGRRHPDLVQEITRRGHEVALHGMDHRRITSMSGSEARSYLCAARDELSQMAGRAISYYRPPYGSQSLGSFVQTVRAGLTPVVWNCDARDWVDRDGEAVASDALSTLRPGAIFLFHERLEPDPLRGAPTTHFHRPSVIQAILDGARKRGLASAPVGSLLHRHGGSKTAWFRP